MSRCPVSSHQGCGIGRAGGGPACRIGLRPAKVQDGNAGFAFGARRQVFAACAAKGIPAVTAAPLGMGAAVLNFLPGGMSFDEYFRLNDGTEAEKPVRFLMGLAPSRLQMGYLADPTTVDLVIP